MMAWNLRLCSVRLLSVVGACLLASYAAPGRAQAQAIYPREALKLHQQGRVLMHLTVSKSGKVTRCVVTESSGSASLDADGCRQALKSVHFSPAHDAAGKAIESSYDLPIKYVLPGS